MSEIDTGSKTRHARFIRKNFAIFSKTIFNSLSSQEMKPILYFFNLRRHLLDPLELWLVSLGFMVA